VELTNFVAVLRALGPDDIERIARAIEASHQTAADEVAAWEDLMRIDDALRRGGRSRAAARAAHDAVAAVRDAVATTDAHVPDAVLTRVAREAALLARAMVADAHDAVAHLEREFVCVTNA
jgi:hypothetical protein